jgi:glutathione S-transferase
MSLGSLTHPVSRLKDSWFRPAHRKSVPGLFRVLDRPLQSSDYPAGDFSSADMANWPRCMVRD